MFKKYSPHVTHFSLHWILIIAFGVQLLAVVGIMGWFAFQNQQKVVQHMAQQLGQSITKKLEYHLHHYFDHSSQLLKIQALALENTVLDLTDSAQIEQNFRDLLQQNTQINQIFFSHHSEILIQVQRNSLSVNWVRKDDYLIPQYSLDQLTWSPIDQNSQAGDLSINGWIPISNSDQNIQGVLGVEISLTPLKNMLRHLELSPSSQAYILDRSGRLIASSSPSPIFQTITQSIRDKFGSLQQIHQPNHCTFNLQGKQQQVYVQPFQTIEGLNWLVMVIIPTQDFTDPVAQQTQLTLLFCGMTVVGLIGIGMLAAHWIVTPLQRLSTAASAIVLHQPTRRVEPMGIQELDLLRNCWNQILQQIEQRTQQLQASNQKLAQVFHRSPVASCISRLRDGCLLEVNETFLHYFGYTQEEIIGYTSQALNLWVNPSDLEQLTALLQQQGAVANYELQLRRKSGDIVTVEIFGTLTEVNGEACLLLAGLDITQRKRGEMEQDLYACRLQMQQIVMLELSKSSELYRGNLEAVLQKITATAAYLLDVNQVSVWFYEQDGKVLRCGNLYQLLLHQYSSGTTLYTEDIPDYLNAIATHPLLVVDDVSADGRIKDLWQSYLEPLGVTSRLDVAIRSEGKTVGILSLEQIHSPRHWLIDEQNFAAYLAHLIALALEARDHAEAEAALRASEERFRQLAENIDNVFWMLDPHQKQIIYISPAYEKIWGRSCAEVYASQTAFVSAIHPEDRDRMIQAMAENPQQQKEIEYRIIRPDGEVRWLRDRAFPIYNDAGALYRVTGIAEDITQDKQASVVLRRSEERLQLALEASGNGLWDWNLITGELYVSPQALQMLGYEQTDFTGSMEQWEELIHPEDQPWVLQRLHDHLANPNQEYGFDYRLQTKSGTWKWIANYGKVVERDSEGHPLRMLGIQQDITQRKKAEEKLQASLREKEVLLREIHHRVKNNLHIISSLLDLQANLLDNEGLLEIFADSQNRIQSMALIHEQLYQSPDLGEVEFGAYIHQLMDNLFLSFSHHLNQVKPVIEVASVYLNLETAIPCGLLINELITNSFKHGFPDQHSGEIYIEFYQQQKQLTLTIWDNGIGIPESVDWQNHSSLGLKLVQILSQQLKAKIKTDFSQGTYFQFIFYPLEYQRRF